MKVLWFVNIPLTPLLDNYGISRETASGSWLNGLLECIKDIDDLKLGVFSPFIGASDNLVRKEIEGVEYFHPLQSKHKHRISSKNRINDSFLSCCKKAIDIFSPDLLHVHGTEAVWGLIKNRYNLSIPMIVSIQGVMELLSRVSWGDLGFFDVLRHQNITPRNLIHFFPELKIRKFYSLLAIRERKILRNADCIIGRTESDKSYSYAVAPKIPYYTVNEMMRKEFYCPKWNINNIQEYTIFTSGRLSHLKGLHILLKAVAILKSDYPEIQIHHAGAYSTNQGAFRYFKKMISEFNLSSNVTFHGHLNAIKIVDLLLRTHVFALPSFGENSCNALQEAQLLGVPCVATHNGGTGSIVQDRKTALLVPSGDEYQMASCIAKIFEDKKLALYLSDNSMEMAEIRNDPGTIIEALMSCYSEMSSCSNGN